MLSFNAKIVETVLFIENEPLSEERLTSLTGLKGAEISKAVRELKRTYEEEGHGIELKEMSEGLYHFAPESELYDSLRQTYGKRVDKRLSRAALETLSIVAYSQPVTRSEVEGIRGVNSDSIMHILREREYIKVVGRKDVPGHPCLYGTTRKFLYEFGLQSISDLPKLTDIDRMRFDENEEGELFK